VVFDGTRPSRLERELLDDLDARVALLPKCSNLGQVLNAGLQRVNTVFTARIDSDDLWPAGRLSSQLTFMREHPDCTVAGSDASTIDSQGRPLGYLAGGRAKDLRRALLLRNQLIHPTAVFRTSVAKSVGGYPSIDRVEDYALWLRLAQHGIVLNSRERWVQYRVHTTQLTNRKISRLGLSLIRQRRVELGAYLGVSAPYSLLAHAAWSVAQVGGRYGLRPLWTRFETEVVVE
jgi:hypothetical protein